MDGENKKKRNRGNRGKHKKSEVPQLEVSKNSDNFQIDDEQIDDEQIDDEQIEDFDSQDYSSNSKPSFISSYSSSANFAPLSSELSTYLNSVHSSITESDILTTDQLQNIFIEIVSASASVATDYTASRILEDLLKQASDYQLRFFLNSVLGSLSDLFKNQCASYVCQTLITLASKTCEREAIGKIDPPPEADTTEEEIPSMTVLIIKSCEELSKSWFSMITDQNATHILRSILMLLSGNDHLRMEKRDSKKRKPQKNPLEIIVSKVLEKHKVNSKPEPKRVVPQEFKETLVGISKELMKSLSQTEFRILAVHPLGNPVLQMLVQIQETQDSIMELILGKKTSTIEFSQFLNSLITHPIGSHLMEKIVVAIPPSLFNSFFKLYFRTKFEEYCTHPLANFVVQRLIAELRNAGQLELLFDELEYLIESLVFSNKLGVVLSLMCACITHDANQKRMMKSLLRAYKVTPEQKELLIRCIMFHKASDVSHINHQESTIKLPKQQISNTSDDFPVNLNGALITQLLFLFDKDSGKLIGDSFLTIPNEIIQNWALDAICSRVVESALTTETLSNKSKKNLVESFQTHFVELARSKYGSHVLDKLWAVADSRFKETIVMELSVREVDVCSTPHGRAIWRNCGVEKAKMSKEDWRKEEERKVRTKILFSEFAETDITEKKDTTKDSKVKKQKEKRKRKASSDDDDNDAVDDK
ncbi:Nucleolar protein 9, partial [Nowakowskiella sp. JEL0078]